MKLGENKPMIPIWGENIPGNTGRSKTDILNIDCSFTIEKALEYPGVWDRSSSELGDMRGNDYWVWMDEIQNGYAHETYSDVPFLIPYLVEGSDKCVISCPGGAYLFKTMDGEGEDVARFLNEAGISCFVLWYRSYPYHAPLMFLDCQRAVRYVRYHAAEYGIDPNKIATVGFSAGGHLCGTEALCFRDEPVVWDGYTPDEVDKADGNPNAVGLIYPGISITDDKIVALIAGMDVYKDQTLRKQFAAQYDLLTHVREGDCPAFLCGCMDDDILPPLRPVDLARAYREKDASCELHLFSQGGHGFGGCVERPGMFGTPDYSACYQWKDLFVNWLNRVL